MAEEQLLSKSNYKQNIIKKGVVEAQYGLNGVIFKCCVIATEEHLVIEDRNDDERSTMSSVCIQWSQLINIDDLNDKNELHSVQLLFKHQHYPSIYIYCTSARNKRKWIKIFEKMCPTIILTKQLQTLKRCAINLGFSVSEIEAALIQYHEKHGTLYNVHVFVAIITGDDTETESETDTKNDEDDDVPNDLQCCICQKLYTQPVANIYDQSYCYPCITKWFENIIEEQTSIKDPYTNQALPQHCRLLMPRFNVMVSIWNYTHKQHTLSDETKAELQSIDDEMDKRRKKILYYLQQTADCQHIASKLADRILESEKGVIDTMGLNDVMDDAIQCYQWFHEIKGFIKKGSDIYNNAIARMIGDKRTQKQLFIWDEPDWENFIDKNSTNWADVYQVDEYLLSEIELHTTQVMNDITKTMEKQKLSTQQIKDEILKIILQKQDELKSNADNAQENEEKVEYKNERRMNMERIMYSEKHGLVSTKCVREIAECIKNDKAFELYHNDWNHKIMNREQLVRFLQTAGMGDGIENQYLVYKSFAMGLKDKMFRLSSYLKTLDEKTFKKFQYFRYLRSVDIIEQEVLDPKEWNAKNDKIELKIKLDCDYDEHLAKYNNDSQKLGNVIKRQMMKQLKIKGAVYANEYIVVKNVQKGCIDISLWFYAPLIATLGGMCDFIYCLYQHYTDPDYYISTRRSILQGMAVGAGLGALGGAALAGGAAIGAIVGCAIGGAVVAAAVCGLIGWGIWKLLKRMKARQIQNEMRPNPLQIQYQIQGMRLIGDGNDEEEQEEEVNAVDALLADGVEKGNEANDADQGHVDDNVAQLEELNQPGGGPQWMRQFAINIDDINKRIRQNENDEWIMILDCNCEVDYKQNRQAEGGYIKCKKHNNHLTHITPLEFEIEHRIGNGADRDGRRAIIAVRNIPQCSENEFNIDEESDSDGV